MRIIGFIEESQAVKSILNSLNLWEVPVKKDPKNDRAPPRKNTLACTDYCTDIDYGWDAYCKDPVWEDEILKAS
ncbi:MAG: hypothetical protein ABIH00_11895 [Armatimonadota bacterium]